MSFYAFPQFHCGSDCQLNALSQHFFRKQRKVLFVFISFLTTFKCDPGVWWEANAEHQYFNLEVYATINSPLLGNKAVIQTSDHKRSVESFVKFCKQPNHHQIIRKENVLHNSSNKSGKLCEMDETAYQNIRLRILLHELGDIIKRSSK